MIDFSGKRGLVLGVGNQRSIAWAVVERLHQQGAELGLTFLRDPKGRFEANVRKLGEQTNATLIAECDVASDESIEALIKQVDEQWGELDFLVHSLAYADTKTSASPSLKPCGTDSTRQWKSARTLCFLLRRESFQ